MHAATTLFLAALREVHSIGAITIDMNQAQFDSEPDLLVHGKYPVNRALDGHRSKHAGVPVVLLGNVNDGVECKPEALVQLFV